MPKSLPASIVIDLNPTAAVGPVACFKVRVTSQNSLHLLVSNRFDLADSIAASIDAVFAWIAEMAGAPMTRFCALADSAAGKL